MIDQLPLTLAQAPNITHAAPPSGESTTAAPGPAGNGTSTTQQPPSAPPSSSRDPFGGSLMFIVLAMVGVMLFMTWNSSRKEKKRRLNLLSNLKKGDKVATVSGIIGSVVELRDSEVVLKVDENSNTRIKFRKAAIETILDDRAPDAKD